MICQQDVHVLSTDGPYDEWDFAAAEEWAEKRELSSAVRRAIGRARQWLLDRQQSDGRWTGRTAGDASWESRYVLLSVFLNGEPSPSARRAAEHVIAAQRPEGGWSAYPGGDADASVSTLAYFALKLTGHEPSCDDMRRARTAILSTGGADAIDMESRYWLALLGQIPYDACSVFSPEVVAPLSIISLRRPVRQIDARRGVRELFIKHPAQWPAQTCPSRALEKRVRIGSLLKKCLVVNLGATAGQASSGTRVFQRVAHRLRRLFGQRIECHCESASLDRLLVAIDLDDREPIEFSNLVWQRIALSALGCSADGPDVRRCEQYLEQLVSDDGTHVRVQPCQTPLIDSALALDALHHSGLRPADTPMADAADWLWNEGFDAPDVCHAARALLATTEPHVSLSPGALPPSLRLLQTATDDASEESPPRWSTFDRTHDGCKQHTASTPNTCQTDYGPRVESAWRQAASWLLAAQNEDGGWSATAQERKHSTRRHANSSRAFFAGDSSTAHVTALVLQSLGRVGLRVGDSHVDRAIAYLNHRQQADGSWPGSHGADCVQGTSQAILGMRSVGVSAEDARVATGVNWLLAHQQSTGGWGESPASKTQAHLRGEGPETIVQTAWAVLALADAGPAGHTATLRGVRYLHEHQQPDGAWEETGFTSVGESQPHYLLNDVQAVCVPLMALSHWATVGVHASARHGESVGKMPVDRPFSIRQPL